MSGLLPTDERVRADNGDRPFLDSKLISTKLPATHVLRPRLVGQVAEGIKHTPLTLISGLAGSGKSVLAASWLADSAPKWPIAWLAVDRSDNQPQEFWTYVLEAMSRCGVELPHARHSEMIDETFLAWLCADLLAQPHPFVLVLDDADRIVNPRILHALDFILTHAPSHFRLLLCCRADPLLPLNRYRLREIITEVRASDLSFTPPETARLLENHELAVSPEFVGELTARTGGWPAALGLAAMALQDSPDGERLWSLNDLSDAVTAEYLMTEVLDAQTPELREVLLRTSVADELTPDLVDELVGHTGGLKILSAFGRANVFVEARMGSAGSRRVHPLLREMLQAQLSYESPQLYLQLHRRCAGWLFAAGQLDAAVDHAVTARDYPYAADMLVERLAVCSILAAGDTLPYVSALDSMPTSVPNASVALIQAAIALTRGNPAAAWQHLARAEANADPANQVQTLSAAVLRATLHAEAADIDQTVSLAADIDALATSDQNRAHPELPALVAASRATAELWRGEYASAEQALVGAAELAAGCGATLLRAQCVGRRALLAALWGRYRQAEELGNAAHGLAMQAGVSARRHPPAAAVALAWAFTQQYRDAQAQHWLDFADESALDNQRQILAPVAAVLRSRLAARGDAAGSADSAPSIDQASVAVAWMRELLAVQSADAELADGRPDRARSAVARFTESNSPRIQLSLDRIRAADGERPTSPNEALDGADIPLDLQVDAWLAQCSFHLEQGQESSAVRAVERALRLAAPEQLRRPFVQTPPRVRDLMQRRVPDQATSWLQAVPGTRSPRSSTAVGSAPAAVGPVLMTQPLSARETEVLGHLAQMLSTQEIGLALFVSVNTVRTHIRSILRKLDVPGRNAAVRRGWELGLIARDD